MREIELAVAQVEAGDAAKGLEWLNKALDQANDEEKYEIAQFYHEWGHLSEARNIVEGLLEHYHDENELIFFLVELLIDSDEEEKAIAWLEEIDDDEVDRLRALLLLADIYSSQGVDEVAEQKLLDAKRLAPEETVITFALAEFYYMTGDYKKSVPLYEQVVRDGGIPGEDVKVRLAEALSASGDFELALPYFQQASQDSIDLNGWMQYGITAFQAGEYQQAIHALNELKARDPHLDSLYFYLAKAYRYEGALSEAMNAAKEGIAMNAFNDQLTYEAGDLALAEGQSDEAEKWFKKTLELHSLHHGALKSLAGIFISQERYDEVIELLGSIEDQEEQDPVFAWNLATAEREVERYEDALRHYDQAHEGLKENPAFLEEYGDFLVEEGRRQEAAVLYRKALSIDPTLVHLEERAADLEQD
ncbi:MAG TPA: tetratricopeptide repeat protein [Bacillales bacterium]|nr:tetratricopeptide repeat protein [Bacillales bacterium]